MQEIKLTPRLKCLADLVEPGARLADIGTDHAHLPLYLLHKGVITQAIGSDLREGPLSRARENAESCGLAGQISLRLASGLAKIAPEECDTLSVAGMGGETIAEILAEAPWTRNGAHRLLLQPMTRIPELRRALWAQGYRIEAEHVLREERRLYLVLVARGGEKPPHQVPVIEDCYVSPALLRDPLAREYIEWLLARERHALCGMEQGTPEESQITAQKRIVCTLESALEDIK